MLGDSSDAQVQIALPDHISAPSIGLDLPIQNPATTDVGALDALLQNGPARYSLSAQAWGEEGNIGDICPQLAFADRAQQMFPKRSNRVPSSKRVTRLC